MLEMNAVRKSYGHHQIFDIPFFRLPSGTYWLRGPNGSGKTTLLRMLSGIETFKGEIRIGNVCLPQNPIGYRRLIGWADAEPAYPEFVTGSELLRFYSDILQPGKRQIRELIERLGVDTWLDSKTGSWSAGMNKRLSLLLAFLGEPKWIFLDEPMITLDDTGLDALSQLLQDCSRDAGTNFLLSSHQLTPGKGLAITGTIIVDRHNIELI